MIPQLPKRSAAQIAHDKFTRYIDSCENSLQLVTALTLIRLFKIRFPKETVLTTKLSCSLQWKRIEIDYLSQMAKS